jgi:acetyl-CoA C-acetyltransferase
MNTPVPVMGTDNPRSEAVDQVDGARIHLAHNTGAPTAVAAVTISEGTGIHG